MLSFLVLEASLWLRNTGHREATGTALSLNSTGLLEKAMDQVIQAILDGLRPMIRALIEQLIRMYREELDHLTQLYAGEIARLRGEMSRVADDHMRQMVTSGFNAIGHGLWTIIVANVAISVIVGIALGVLLFFVVRYKWRRWRWEPKMLAATQRQNTLLEEQNKLLAALVEQKTGHKP